MSYSAPLPSEFKARHPSFASVSDAMVCAMLEEAGRQVDESWTEGDYANAIMYLAAHMLVMEGALTPSGSMSSPATSGPVTSMSLGDASETYATERTGATSMGELGSTVYGQRFSDLRRRNVGGPRVA